MTHLSEQLCKSIKNDYSNMKAFGKMGEVLHNNFDKIRMARNPERLIAVKGREIVVCNKKLI